MTRTALARLLVLHGLLGAFLTSAPGIAGVTLDGTLGPRASLSGNMIVPASLGTQRGANLFHSFGTFNILTGESLYFTPTGSSGAISNVISRVTGGSGSTINGVLGSTISGANLFLINPSGIVFGPNAQLDIAGSFYASTANYLKFADGGRFSATTPANTSLTVAAPAAFGFLGATPAAITVNGSQLVVPVGKTLGLVGGDITLRNAAILAAPGGTAHVVSTASTGEARLTAGALDVSSFTQLGAISVRGFSTVEVSKLTGQNNGGGSVYVRGGNFVLDESSVLAQTGTADGGVVDISVSRDLRANGGVIDTRTFGAGRGGDIMLTAGGAMSLDASSLLSSASSNGNAGNILINAADLSLHNAGIATSGARFGVGTGGGGDITLTATGAMTVDAFLITAKAFGDGNAGNILINAGDISLFNAEITSSGARSGIGRGGNITLNTPGTMSMTATTITSQALGRGDAGNIHIGAGTLNLIDAGITSSGARFGDGAGAGGDITLSTSGTMTVNKFRITSEALGDGNAGNVLVNAGEISLFNAEITSSGAEFGIGRGGNITLSTPGTMSMTATTITSEALGIKAAGNIRIAAGTLNLIDAGITSSGASSGQGAGGDITLTTAGTMTVNKFLITAKAFGDGNAGNILINAGNMSLADAEITSSGAESGKGRGGNITLTAPGTISMDAASTITSEALGTGDAGNIVINAGSVSLAYGSQIRATSALDGLAGDAGSISINAGSKLLLDGSSIATSTLNADGGNINIVARDLIYLKNSTISSSVQGGEGNGGNIFIDPTFLVLNNSSIIANAFGGDGGNITINAGYLFQSPASVIDASSALGISGSVVISAPVVDLAGGLVALPASYLDTSALLANRCAARMAGNASSLVLAGRGGLPVEPDGWISGAGSVVPAASVAAAVSPPEHRPLFPLLGSSYWFECAR